MAQTELSIVVPAYCEERRIVRTLNELGEFLKQDKFFKSKAVEVIVVAADTPDRTHELVLSEKGKFKNFLFLKPGLHVGKGRDVQYGMLRAKGKYIVFMDADLATPLHHLKEFYETCDHGRDIVVGTRDLFHYRSSRLRNIFSGLGNLLYQLIGGIHIDDTQCGFKMFTHNAAQLCFSKLTIMGWGFDLEVLAIAKANKLSIIPIRIADWVDKPFSTHNDGAIQITWRMVRDFIRISVNNIRNNY